MIGDWRIYRLEELFHGRLVEKLGLAVHTFRGLSDIDWSVGAERQAVRLKGGQPFCRTGFDRRNKKYYMDIKSGCAS
jgi:hypothetical protein